MFIPTPPEGELPPEAWRQQAGQFANDLAFEPGLLAQKDAYWVYEQASAESNLLALFWSVRLEEGKGAEGEAQWVPGEVQLVTQRDTRLPARAGVAHAVSEREAGLVFDALDADGSGTISYPEFAALFDAALLGRGAR